MPDDIGVFIEGDRALELRFDSLPKELHDRLKGVVIADIAALANAVRAAVPKRTGKLASEVVSSVRDSPDRITGVVSFAAEFAKAGALEYGGTGKPFRVRPHPMRLDHVFANRVTPESVLVEAHSRAIHIAARRFLRGSIEARKAAIENDLRSAVTQTVEQGEQ